MRIVHIARSDCRGGAARSAFRLHQGLLALGHDSSMLVQEKHSDLASVHLCAAGYLDEKAMQRLRWVESRAIRNNRSALSNTYFSLNEPAWDLSHHSLVRDADVINLHWVAGFQSPRSITALLRLNKPLVWTLHDQRPFTGGCHFTAGCSRFQDNCAACPQLQVDAGFPGAQLDDIARYLAGSAMTLVCPSRWMTQAAGLSRAFGHLKREVIPYGLDTTRFQPQAKPDLRRALKLPADAVCLLFGADNANEKRKGFDHLVGALEKCCERFEGSKVLLVSLGHPSGLALRAGLPVVNTGYLTNDQEISQWYAASDLFVLPSLEDNLPNTVLEAMSCALPVAAFAAGGIPELVSSETGKLAPPGDTNALAEAMVELVLDEKLRCRLGASARAVALKQHGLEVQAQRYATLYQSLPAARARFRKPRSRQTAPAIVPLGPRFAQVYYRTLLEAMRHRRAHGDEALPYRKRNFGRQRLVLAWHSLRFYYWLVNRARRGDAGGVRGRT